MVLTDLFFQGPPAAYDVRQKVVVVVTDTHHQMFWWNRLRSWLEHWNPEVAGRRFDIIATRTRTVDMLKHDFWAARQYSALIIPSRMYYDKWMKDMGELWVCGGDGFWCQKAWF